MVKAKLGRQSSMSQRFDREPVDPTSLKTTTPLESVATYVAPIV